MTSRAPCARVVLVGRADGVRGIGLFWPPEPAKPLVKVTWTDGSEVCGNLLGSDAKAPVRVKRSNGDVAYVAAAELSTITIATKCSS